MHAQVLASSLQRQRPAARLPAAAAQRRRPPLHGGGKFAIIATFQQQQQQQQGTRSVQVSSADTETADIVSYAKRRLQQRMHQEQQLGPMGDFVRKVKLAWHIFFPEQQRLLSPKEEGKQRLRMILVADRVGMNEVTMEAMRERIIGAVSKFVEIESPDLVEVAVTTDVELGAIYSVAVPVRRVKAAARVPLNEDGDITFHWDPTDEESDPSSQFPYGT